MSGRDVTSFRWEQGKLLVGFSDGSYLAAHVARFERFDFETDEMRDMFVGRERDARSAQTARVRIDTRIARFWFVDADDGERFMSDDERQIGGAR